LIEVLRGQFANAPAAVYAEAKASDIRHSLGLPAAAKSELGFAANVSLENGLAAMLGGPDQR
jgi:hypothetical protein